MYTNIKIESVKQSWYLPKKNSIIYKYEVQKKKKKKERSLNRPWDKKKKKKKNKLIGLRGRPNHSEVNEGNKNK